MRIEKIENKIVVESPYHPRFPHRAKKLGGRWDSGAKEWTFDARDEERVRALCLEIYGEDGNGTSDLVTVRVSFEKDCWAAAAGYFVAGRCVGRAFGRDSGARLGEGVVVIEGSVSSGGSRKNWTTFVKAGTVIEIRDLPRTAAEGEVKSPADDYTVEIVEAVCERKAALEADAEKLRERLAVIEAELASM